VRKYELLYIVRPDLEAEAVDELMNGIRSYIEQEGGKVLWMSNLRKRRLAYPVKKHKEGIYVQMNFEAPPELPRKLERNLELNDNVIRYLTVRDDEGRLLKAAKEG